MGAWQEPRHRLVAPPAGTPVLLLIQDLNIRIITEDGEILREPTVDPTRDYQPLDK